MTGKFIRNIIFFVGIAILAKSALNSTVKAETAGSLGGSTNRNAVEGIQILAYSAGEEDKLVGNSCLGMKTSFPATKMRQDPGAILRQKTLSEYLLSTRVWNNTVGTANITHPGRQYNMHAKQRHVPNDYSVSDILIKNRVVIKVSADQAEVLDQNIKDSTDIGYIVNGTVLEEIYINQGINKIEKVKTLSENGSFYALELATDSAKTSIRSRELLSNLDNIRRFESR